MCVKDSGLLCFIRVCLISYSNYQKKTFQILSDKFWEDTLILFIKKFRTFRYYLDISESWPVNGLESSSLFGQLWKLISARPKNQFHSLAKISYESRLINEELVSSFIDPDRYDMNAIDLCILIFLPTTRTSRILPISSSFIRTHRSNWKISIRWIKMRRIYPHHQCRHNQSIFRRRPPHRVGRRPSAIQYIHSSRRNDSRRHCTATGHRLARR